MKPGQSYTVKKYYWLVCPTYEISKKLTAAARAPSLDGLRWRASFWGKQFDCNISILTENSNFMVIDVKAGVNAKLVQILAADKTGWIFIMNEELCKESFELLD